jgi:hypothetical protein
MQKSPLCNLLKHYLLLATMSAAKEDPKKRSMPSNCISRIETNSCVLRIFATFLFESALRQFRVQNCSIYSVSQESRKWLFLQLLLLQQFNGCLEKKRLPRAM